jgi:calcineurin-like phosphoesterase family protein
MFCFSSVCGTCSCYLLHLILVSGTSYKLLEEDVTTYQEIVIDNAGHRTLLHPPQKKTKHTRKPTKKRQYTKVTTVLPLEGRRHQKHAMRSKKQTVNEPISFS